MTYTPYFVHGEDRPGRWLVTCDHASNLVPPFVNGGDLGLPREDMERHIAYDVGAYGLSVAPSNLVVPEIQAQPDGQLFNTITNGVRNMPAYAHQVKVQDRWAIVAYVRVLQYAAGNALFEKK